MWKRFHYLKLIIHTQQIIYKTFLKIQLNIIEIQIQFSEIDSESSMFKFFNSLLTTNRHG